MPTRTDAERIEAVLTGRDPATGEACDRLDPAALDGDEWQTVFFACNEAGVPEATVDAWNASDPARYDQRKNATRYRSLDPGKAGNAGMGSFVNVCKAHGVKVPNSGVKGPNSGETIVPGAGRKWTTRLVNGRPEIVYLDEAPGGTTRPQSAPAEERKPNRLQQCRDFLRALFKPGEYVCLDDSRAAPDKRGKYGPTGTPAFVELRDLIDRLDDAEAKGATDPDRVLEGLFPRELSGHGVFVCYNPFKPEAAGPVPQGSGAKTNRVDSFVADFRNVMVEGDENPIAEQLQCYEAVGLRPQTVTLSGNKSAHAIVRVDAPNDASLKRRFGAIAELCAANGVKLDQAGKNAHGYSRLAGTMRDGKAQELIESHRCSYMDPRTGWDAWACDSLAESAKEKPPKTDAALPMPTDLSDGWGEDRRAPDLIEGMLRCGQLGMMAGPSKAGKSWAAIQLAVAVATGGRWLDRQCKQGRVLYVDYELAPESSDRRVWEVAQAAWGLQHDLDRGGFDALVKANVRPLHLRGTFKPTEQYAAHIKAVCEATGPYDLIIVDPFYRFSDADENSAKETGGVMAMGYGIVDATGAAVMIVHHYPKGKPGQKDALDRMSGSGVLTRSPDCLLDFAPLDDDVGDPDLAVVLNGKVAVEVTPTVRDHPPVKPFRVIRDHPLMLPTDNEAVAKLDVKGANRPAENKRKAARAKAREHDHCDKCLMDSWERSNEHHFTYEGVEYAPWPRMRDVLDKDPETGIAGSTPTINGRLKESSLFGCTTPRALGMGEDQYKDRGLTWNETLAYVVHADSDAGALDPHGEFTVTYEYPDDSTGTC